MNKKMVKAIAFIICLAMVITSFSFVFFLPSIFAGTETNTEDTTSKEYLNERVLLLREYMEWIAKNYKDAVDYKTLSKGAMEGITESLGDVYSEYFAEQEDGDAFKEAVSGEYVGLGVTLQSVNGVKTIIEVNPDGPAEEAGVKAGDIILKINGKAAESMTLDEVSKEMKGEEGTKAVLVVKRDGSSLTFTITRAQIALKSLSYELKDGNIGYINISRMDDDIAKEFRLAKIALVNSGADSLLIDIRDNPGGAMEQAVSIADQLLPEGAVISYYVQQGKVISTVKASGERTSKLPVVLLVNENSASACEVLAGALQDNNEAVLVGTTTFGKGIAQSMINFKTEESSKISVFYFTTPNKKDIHGIGITPDYVVRNTSGSTEAYIKEYEGFAPMSEGAKPCVGDTGLNVYGAQQRLKFLGYYTGSVTGTMDAATGEALKKFQKDEGLYPYATLDNTTRSRLAAAAYNKAYGVGAGQDLQMEKAIEILKTMK
ncbi:MAG: S41 family peptidase [Anaerovoracaceae bacterium]